jgi:hypothetical protein
MNQTLNQLVAKLRSEWLVPSKPSVLGMQSPFRLACKFEKGLSEEEIRSVVDDVTPPELREFWRSARAAKLFFDVDFGQWGLNVFSPETSRIETAEFRTDREADFVVGDVVCGRFYGDTDMLLIRSDPAARDFGTVIVALPLYPRKDWFLAAKSFTIFLKTYAETFGDKFWETNKSSFD